MLDQGGMHAEASGDLVEDWPEQPRQNAAGQEGCNRGLDVVDVKCTEEPQQDGEQGEIVRSKLVGRD